MLGGAITASVGKERLVRRRDPRTVVVVVLDDFLAIGREDLTWKWRRRYAEPDQELP